jgi:hypothetical protein
MHPILQVNGQETLVPSDEIVCNAEVEIVKMSRRFSDEILMCLRPGF